ncbi:hypothetical protein [Bradyrhizobium sp. CCBAU 53421]|uniref:hypothetical protein n=1 Tax=Bradyrhizobium sp. CCBAU 53421 TaxID=1325120 RepID=UPI00188B4DB4|nr:hypothetical protein [Bradyrhizobium sp. CCBAU 53421]
MNITATYRILKAHHVPCAHLIAGVRKSREAFLVIACAGAIDKVRRVKKTKKRICSCQLALASRPFLPLPR